MRSQVDPLGTLEISPAMPTQSGSPRGSRSPGRRSKPQRLAGRQLRFLALFIRPYLRIGHSRGVIHRHVHKVPSRLAIGATAISGDAMPNTCNAFEFLHIQVQDSSGKELQGLVVCWGRRLPELRRSIGDDGVDSQALRVLAVLGMHRSGTSCLAGVLQCMGLPAGRVEQWNADNMRGQRENLAVWRLNERVLAENGGRWDAPPAKLQWGGSLAAARDAFLAENIEPGQPWMFKDPRTLLTLPFWQEAVPELRKIGTFRHPLRVAASLYFRDKMPIRYGLELWYTYNERLLREHDREEFPVLCFDLSRESYLRGVSVAVSTLCADWIARGHIRTELGAQFYDHDLVHQKQQDAEEWSGMIDDLGDMPKRARELYQRLRAIAGANEADVDQTRTSEAASEPVIPALHAADLLAKENRREEAMERFRTLLPKSSDRPAIWKRMITLLKQLNQTREALELYREATADCPTDATLWLEMSQLQWVTGDLDGALTTCRRATEAAPSWPHSWSQQGHWLMHKQRWVEAAACFERAIEINGGSDGMRVHLGNAYLHSGRRAEGEVQLEVASRSTDDKIAAMAHRTWGEALKAAGDAAGAVSQYQQAVDRDPRNVHGHIVLAHALVAAKRRPEAIGALLAVRTQFPDHLPALPILIDLLRQEGQTAMAAEQELILEQASPDLPAAHRILGQRAARLDQWEKAIGHFQRWSDEVPGTSAPQVEIARCLLKLRRAQACLDRLHAVLEREPEHPGARALLPRAQELL
jgi:Tfp pilus assembly protein PilF